MHRLLLSQLVTYAKRTDRLIVLHFIRLLHFGVNAVEGVFAYPEFVQTAIKQHSQSQQVRVLHIVSVLTDLVVINAKFHCVVSPDATNMKSAIPIQELATVYLVILLHLVRVSVMIFHVDVRIHCVAMAMLLYLELNVYVMPTIERIQMVCVQWFSAP
jgi:hypothetical protein